MKCMLVCVRWCVYMYVNMSVLHFLAKDMAIEQREKEMAERETWTSMVHWVEQAEAPLEALATSSPDLRSASGAGLWSQQPDASQSTHSSGMCDAPHASPPWHRAPNRDVPRDPHCHPNGSTAGLGPPTCGSMHAPATHCLASLAAQPGQTCWSCHHSALYARAKLSPTQACRF